MHRRMPILIVALFTIIGFTGVALASCTGPSCVYVPVIAIERTPTPIPTPIPLVLSSLVIQISEMKSGYTLDTFQELTNADAAKGYKDPKGALRAFAEQGRESSWRAVYFSTDYLFSDAVGVSSQVTRYLTVDGATLGFQYTVGKAQQDHADYRLFNITAPCCPVVGFRRTFTDDGLTYDQFDIITQARRYVSDVQVISLAGSISVDQAVAYANIPLIHILNTPQVMHSDAQTTSFVYQPNASPSLESLRAALTPR